jgi:hypothetical protein
MDDFTHITIRVPQQVAAAVSARARAMGLETNGYLCAVLARELGLAVVHPPHPAQNAPLQLDAFMRNRLSRDVAMSQDWTDLQLRLGAQGYTLRPAGTGLALYLIRGNVRVCALSALGPAHGQLAARFGTPFPNHPKGHLFQRKRAGHLSAPDPIRSD